MQAKRYNFTRTKLIYRSPSRIWSRFIAGKFIEQFFSKKNKTKKPTLLLGFSTINFNVLEL